MRSCSASGPSLASGRVWALDQRPWSRNPGLARQFMGVDELPELQHDSHWKIGVWTLRVGYFGWASS